MSMMVLPSTRLAAVVVPAPDLYPRIAGITTRVMAITDDEVPHELIAPASRGKENTCTAIVMDIVVADDVIVCLAIGAVHVNPIAE